MQLSQPFGDLDDDIMIYQSNKQKQQQKTKKSKPKKKQKYDQMMKKLPKSCFSCKTHQQEYLRLIPEPSATNVPFCKSCGFKCSGKLGYLVCPKTSSCYTLCSACKICHNNHILRKLTTLNHLSGNTLYQQNKFKCNRCKETKQLKNRKNMETEQKQMFTQFVYHCNVCSFGICNECIEETNKLWIKKEKELNLGQQY